MSLLTANQVIAAQIAEPVVCGIIVAARTAITLTYGKRKLGWADWSILLTYATLVASAGLLLKQLSLDNKGQRQAKTIYEKALPILALNEHDLNVYLKMQYSAGTLYYIKTWLIKFSLCFTYLELSKYLTKRNKWILYGVIGYGVVTFGVGVAGWLGTCQPKYVPLPLDPTAPICPKVTVGNAWTWYIGTITSDIGLLIFAFILITSLKLRSGPKIAILIVVLIGCISVISATIRFAFIIQFLGGKFARNNDPVFAARAAIFWANMETIFGLFAACLPAFRLLFRESIGDTSKVGSYGSSGTGSGTGGSSGISSTKPLNPLASNYSELKNMNSTTTSNVSLAHSTERQYV